MSDLRTFTNDPHCDASRGKIPERLTDKPRESWERKVSSEGETMVLTFSSLHPLRLSPHFWGGGGLRQGRSSPATHFLDYNPPRQIMPSSGRLKPMLVGEQNPYGGEPQYALYPAPDGCSGQRLCCVIFGMNRAAYLREFDRTNLCPGEWNAREAEQSASALFLEGQGNRRFVLLGSKVCAAFGVQYRPFTLASDRVLILPHPSGRCRMWNDPRSFLKARACLVTIAPELFSLIGVADR